MEGSWIGQLKAIDEDFSDRDSLIYRATVGNAVGLVNVTRDGRLVLNKGVKLESGRTYSMIVEASDSGKKKVNLFETNSENFIRFSHFFKAKLHWCTSFVRQNMTYSRFSYLFNQKKRKNWITKKAKICFC